eukprot:scaffold2045_cov404-Prasinococcus_capsulatus_cf.AAC.51
MSPNPFSASAVMAFVSSGCVSRHPRYLSGVHMGDEAPRPCTGQMMACLPCPDGAQGLRTPRAPSVTTEAHVPTSAQGLAGESEPKRASLPEVPPFILRLQCTEQRRALEDATIWPVWTRLCRGCSKMPATIGRTRLSGCSVARFAVFVAWRHRWRIVVQPHLLRACIRKQRAECLPGDWASRHIGRGRLCGEASGEAIRLHAAGGGGRSRWGREGWRLQHESHSSRQAARLSLCARPRRHAACGGGGRRDPASASGGG